MQGTHDEFHRCQAIEEAIGIEHNPDMLLS
jgi:hypothetical protein